MGDCVRSSGIQGCRDEGSLVTVSDGNKTFARDRSSFKKLLGRRPTEAEGKRREVELDERLLDQRWKTITQQPRVEPELGVAEVGGNVGVAMDGELRRSTRAKNRPARFGK